MATKRPFPWGDAVDVKSYDSSSSSSSSSADSDGENNGRVTENTKIDDLLANQLSPEALLMRKAETYQEYMKLLPIPTEHRSVIPCNTWMGLGGSVKQLYGQPLHYLTNVQLKKWDQMRFGTEDESTPLDLVIHPVKAEATIWLMEEIHRQTTSHRYLAKLWLSDPMHYTFIDNICPPL